MTEVTPTATGMAVSVDIDKPTVFQESEANVAKHKDFFERIPSELQAKEWVDTLKKSEDPLAEMFKRYDGLFSKLGAKPEGLLVPGEKATPDDWANFHKAIGVPENADGYEYKGAEIPDNLKQFISDDPELVKVMKDALHKAGVRKDAANVIFDTFNKYSIAKAESQIAEANKTLAELENGFKQKFGDRSNAVLDNFKKSTTGLLSAEEAAIFDNLHPAVKVALAAHHEAFSKKYIREDSLNFDVPQGQGQMNEKEYGQKYMELLAAQRKAQVGSSEYIRLTHEIESLQKTGRAIFQK